MVVLGRHALLWALAALAAAPAWAQDAPPRERFEALLREMAAQGIVRHPDLTYASRPTSDPNRLELDVYTVEGAARRPVVVFFHGGSWQAGDKAAVGRKPLAFVPAGYVVVSATYRFRPEVTVSDMAGDAAAAVGWVKDNIARYGGDPARVFLMGHSAGAHLVSVLGTNLRLLASAGVPSSSIRGVVSLDTGPYDVARQIALVQGQTTVYAKMIRTVFGTDPAAWPEVSPVDHVKRDAGIPPFLVVASDNRADVPVQAQPFVAALQAAGVPAELYIARERTHASLNAELGAPGDPTTAKVLAFCDSRR